MIKYDEEVDKMEKETELYNSVYREICEIAGLDATLKIYLRFKGQQISFPVRLYNPHLIQQNVIKEYDGSNIRELAKKYDDEKSYSFVNGVLNALSKDFQ
jgi:Mor family transcriptional regulator